MVSIWFTIIINIIIIGIGFGVGFIVSLGVGVAGADVSHVASDVGLCVCDSRLDGLVGSIFIIIYFLYLFDTELNVYKIIISLSN